MYTDQFIVKKITLLIGLHLFFNYLMEIKIACVINLLKIDFFFFAKFTSFV